MMRILKEDASYTVTLEWDSVKFQETTFILTKWLLLTSGACGGDCCQCKWWVLEMAVSEIKMRWKGFSWWKMTLAKPVCFSWGGAVGVPSCQDMLFSRMGYQTNFSFVEYSDKDTDNTTKLINEKPIETFISHHWECCCALSLFHTHISQWCQLFTDLSWLVILKFYPFHMCSALLIGQWKQVKTLSSLELEIRGVIGRKSESRGKAP